MVTRTATRQRLARHVPAPPRSGPSPLTVAQVAAELGVGTATVLGWIRSGELAAINVSRSRQSKKPRWRITRAVLDAFTVARAAIPAPSKSSRRTRAAADVIEFYP
jgi:excisionase family DNA binding protein